MQMMDSKQEVRQFYDEIGWSRVGEDLYQNARYEDLRPVSRRYIHDCHLRVARHLQPQGRFFLDAGSGPVQYPEYLEYSRGYQYRICADISITALREARRRLQDHGLFVVADIANLPFKHDAFEGVVSLHTIHHLSEEEHLQAYRELHRVLAPGCRAVVVNGWANSRLMQASEPLIRLANSIRHWTDRRQRRDPVQDEPNPEALPTKPRQAKVDNNKSPKGTFTRKHHAAWIKKELGSLMPVEILVWRSVTVRFMRALIHPSLGGQFWLRLLYALEERFPRFFGENGKYPMIIIQKETEMG